MAKLINTYRSFNENDYDNLRLLLSKLIGSELNEKICSKRNKENLMNLSYIFEISNSQEIIRIISQFCLDRNLIDKIIVFSQNLRKLEVDSWDDDISRDVIDQLLRLYNIIYNHISEEKRFKISEKYFLEYKTTIDKKANEVALLFKNKELEVNHLYTKIENKFLMKEERLLKNVEKSDGLIENLEIVHSNYLKKQSEFEIELQTEHDEFKKDIEEQLRDIQDSVYRNELAGYFLGERKSLKGEVNIGLDFKSLSWLFTPYWGWLIATFIGMCCILLVAYNVSLEKFEYQDMLKRMPLFMSLIWFTWFCSKQFSYTKQICDEYEYKYLLSMSYLGYKNEAKEIGKSDEERALLVTLLDSVIKNVATSPIQCVKSDCHTPFSEVFREMKVSLGKDKFDSN